MGPKMTHFPKGLVNSFDSLLNTLFRALFEQFWNYKIYTLQKKECGLINNNKIGCIISKKSLKIVLYTV